MNCQIVELSDYQFIKVSGPDFRKFLQGQLSCNMDNLAQDRSLRGAICNLKGRVVADLRVLQHADGCLLQVGAGMAPAVLATLAKYAVFSKVKLEQLNLPMPPLGLLGEPGEQGHALFKQLPQTVDAVSYTEAASLIRVAGAQPRYELWITGDATEQAVLLVALRQKLAASEHWHRAELEAGVIHIDTVNTEQYTPQLLNYDIAGVIDFKKGCYTGQEVVARMFYRGTAKKRMYLASTKTPIGNAARVQQLEGGDDKSAEILAFSNALQSSDQPNLLLTILGTDAVEGGSTFVLEGQPETPLTLLPLTYSGSSGQS